MVNKSAKKKRFAASGNFPQCGTDSTTNKIPEHKFGSKKFKKVLPPWKRKTMYQRALAKTTYCDVCCVQCTSENQLEEHLRGARHKQALQMEENVTEASECEGGAITKDCSYQKRMKAAIDKYAIYRSGQNADKSTESVQNAGKSTNPVQNAGKSTNPVQNAGKSTNPERTFPDEKQDEMEGTLKNSDDCIEEEDDEEDEHFELRTNTDLEQYLKTFKILTEEDASFVLNVIQTITQALLQYKDDCMAKKATEATAESGDSSTSTVVSNPSRKRPLSPSSETDFAKKAKSECSNSSPTPLQDQQASNPSLTEDSSHRLQGDAGLTSPGSPGSSETPSYVHTIITQLFGNRYNLGLTEVILELTNNDALKDPSIDAEAIIRTLVRTGRLNVLLT